MTRYCYKIMPDMPCVIWVRPDWHYSRWRRWGCFDTPAQARHALRLLRCQQDDEPLTEEDVRQVVLA